MLNYIFLGILKLISQIIRRRTTCTSTFFFIFFFIIILVCFLFFVFTCFIIIISFVVRFTVLGSRFWVRGPRFGRGPQKEKKSGHHHISRIYWVKNEKVINPAPSTAHPEVHEYFFCGACVRNAVCNVVYVRFYNITKKYSWTSGSSLIRPKNMTSASRAVGLFRVFIFFVPPHNHRGP